MTAIAKIEMRVSFIFMRYAIGMAFDADNKWVDIRLMAIVIIDELIIDK